MCSLMHGDAALPKSGGLKKLDHVGGVAVKESE